MATLPNSTLFNNGLFGGPATSPTTGTLVSDILYVALRIANVLAGAGRGYSASQASDGLNALNAMLDAWNTEQLIIYAERIQDFSLIGGQQDYTIGPQSAAADTVDFDTTRPMTLDRASIIWTGNQDQPLEVPLWILTYAQWQLIPVKNTGSNIPTRVYYETSNPIGVLHFWPIPSANVTFRMYVAQQLAQVSGLDARLSLPPGYLRAIQYNLAVELADRFPRANLKPNSQRIAVESKAWVKRRNVQPQDIYVDQALRVTAGKYDIYTDSFGR